MALKEIYFFDITKIGRDLTGKRDISLLTNEQALLESVMNIVQTEPGERVYNPEFGCGLSRYLFEPIDQISALYIQQEIETSILRFEPRIEELQVMVDVSIDEQTYDITVLFSMKVTNDLQKINFSLNKVR